MENIVVRFTLDFPKRNQADFGKLSVIVPDELMEDPRILQMIQDGNMNMYGLVAETFTTRDLWAGNSIGVALTKGDRWVTLFTQYGFTYVPGTPANPSTDIGLPVSSPQDLMHFFYASGSLWDGNRNYCAEYHWQALLIS